MKIWSFRWPFSRLLMMIIMETKQKVVVL